MEAATIFAVKIPPRRMLTKQEAAAYCGLRPRAFAKSCRISMVAFPNGELLYDIRDLDHWLDTIKNGGDGSAGHDEILGRLD